ncbi:hypothetical protein [Sphingomonas sp.]|uniref:hypothetical protein n=1 Tax=Sphingomonas sp. TaxID=28214 RepID=UPI0025EDC1C6|nr:hypothetical protein [Sphingomonas sp.]
MADLFGSAPIALRARITDATRVKDAVVPAGTARFYITADVISLIRAPAGVPPRITYLVDIPVDSRGRPPRLKKTEVLLAALPVAGRPGEIQLAARDAQLLWTAPLEAQARAVIAAVVARDAAPVVTGVGSAFHVAGSIPGESETQVFLTTTNGAPVSLSILRRPGEAPRWALALGEIVDEAAGPPGRDTLAWYRLACFLPRTMPDAAIAELAPADAAVAREDYAFVIAELGVCARSRA